MRRRHSATADAGLRLDMTPMIDCVFQLLIFFLVTLKFDDLLAHLDILRPRNVRAPIGRRIGDLRLGVCREGLALNDRLYPATEVERLLRRRGNDDAGQSIVIECAPDSEHAVLVQALDLCAGAGLTNLIVMSK